MATVTDSFTGTGSLTNWSKFNYNASLYFDRSSDQCRATTGTSEPGMFWNANTFTGDQYAQVTVKALPASEWGHGPALKWNDASYAGYLSHFKGNQIRVRNNSSSTYPIDVSTTVSVDDVIKLTVETSGGNDTLKLYKNGSLLATSSPLTAISGGTRIGIYSYYSDTSARVDDFEGGDLTAPTPPNAPSGVTSSSVSYTSASISWTDNSSDETGFKVRYSPSPYSSWTTATGSVAASPYLVTGLSDATSYKAAVAAFNANGDSTWAESGVFTTSTLSKLRPNADTSTGSWSASSGSVLYSMIDETSADDADYISTTASTTCKLKFETSTDPSDNGNHAIRLRARSTSGTLTVRLVQGDPAETTIVSWVPTLTSSFADYQYDLSTAEASVITDYSALYLKLTSS